MKSLSSSEIHPELALISQEESEKANEYLKNRNYSGAPGDRADF